jgi:predicted TIM-barrel fold metal-dependent hydrolase
MLTGIIFPLVWDDIRRVEEGSGIRITSFSKYLEATEILIEKAYEMGVIALKNQLAYIRTLKYERVNRTLAEDEFYNIFKTKHIPDWHERQVLTGQSFQDYMFHFILDIANKKNLIIQIHTGLQEGNGNILSNSNPVLLSNLFLEYPDINFDIFHMSYPFQDVLTVLSKNYSNVFIDMCWAHIVSPNASINALLEWFDTVPLNKVSAFGGDYEHVDGVYGHLKIAQQNIAIALSIKVDQKLFDIDEAKKIAVMLFYDNPKKLFRI